MSHNDPTRHPKRRKARHWTHLAAAVLAAQYAAHMAFTGMDSLIHLTRIPSPTVIAAKVASIPAVFSVPAIAAVAVLAGLAEMWCDRHNDDNPKEGS